MPQLQKTLAVSYDEFKPYIIETGIKMLPGFNIDATNDDLYKNLYNYLSRIKGAYNLDKGILLAGPKGVGKTLAFKVMRELFKNYAIVSCRHVVRDYVTLGPEAINIYGRDSFKKTQSGHNDYNKPLTYMFDDLASEESESKLYGNSTQVMLEILLDRYENYCNHGQVTFATTNANPEMIEQKYGERLRDRFREMFNYVTLSGESKRK